MKILFTGSSSFTGYWFVRALAAAGHEVTCTLTRSLENYSDLRRQRLDLLKPLCRFAANTAFGSETFIELAQGGSFDVFCHHGADVTNYKSPDFDAVAALQNNTRDGRRVLSVLKSRGVRAVVLTGTTFENDEGAGDEPLRAFSPYGLSKGMTFQYFRHYCRETGLPLGKFVVPNPFGPFEEPRFTAFVMKNWKAGAVVEVKTPDYIRDNIHVDLLALAYAAFVNRAGASRDGLLKANPSGYVERQGAFAQRLAREVKVRTGWACELKLASQADFSEPLHRANTEPAAALSPGWNEAKAWDEFVKFYAA